MKKYTVHVYAVVRVKLDPVEAESQEDAISKAAGKLDTYSLFNYIPAKPLSGVQEVEDAEEVAGYLVDEVGDEEYQQSRFYKADGTVDRAESYNAAENHPNREVQP